MSVPKRLRYEILRRDNHACRYCGATAPDVPLTVDHVVPVALGGTDDPGNLVTACRPCNEGKASSSPDAPIVEDIDVRAAMWRNAMAIVAQQRADERDEHDRITEYLWTGMRSARTCGARPTCPRTGRTRSAHSLLPASMCRTWPT